MKLINKRWCQIKWITKQFILMLSSRDSVFSKKRSESFIAFVIAEVGAVYFLLNKIESMTTSDFGIWIGLQFIVAGYTVNQIQQEKKELNKPEEIIP